MSELRFNVLEIIRGTTVDGPGFRTSIYLAGCSHRCPGCHNPQSHDPNAGIKMSLKEILQIVKEEDFDVTLTGGDPLYHPYSTLQLAKAIYEEGYKIWLYTGFTVEEIMRSEVLSPVIQYVDTIVDGKFVEALRDPDLPFRGSYNQRIVPVSSLHC